MDDSQVETKKNNSESLFLDKGFTVLDSKVKSDFSFKRFPFTSINK